MNANERYFDSIAPLYDGLNPIEHDVELYCQQAADVDGRVLEIGCGTGRVYLQLLRQGVDAYGIDISREMLAELERRAEAEGLEPAVERADMRDFSTAVRHAAPFELVIVPLRTFQMNLTVADQLATLEEIRSVLADGGKLVIDVLRPVFDIICEVYDEERRNTYEIDGHEYTVVDRNTITDEIEQNTEVERRIYDEDGELVASEAQRTALLPKQQVELLLECVGFTAWDVYGGYELADLETQSESETAGVPHPDLIWIVEN